jgi:hypothetical protein
LNSLVFSSKLALISVTFFSLIGRMPYPLVCRSGGHCDGGDDDTQPGVTELHYYDSTVLRIAVIDLCTRFCHRESRFKPGVEKRWCDS